MIWRLTTSRAHDEEKGDLFKDAHNFRGRVKRWSVPYLRPCRKLRIKRTFPHPKSAKERVGKSKYSRSTLSLEIQPQAPELSRHFLCYCWTFCLLQLHSHLSSQVYYIFSFKRLPFHLASLLRPGSSHSPVKVVFDTISCSSILLNILWSSNQPPTV